MEILNGSFSNKEITLEEDFNLMVKGYEQREVKPKVALFKCSTLYNNFLDELFGHKFRPVVPFEQKMTLFKF